jgi:hypothetical protein
MLIMLFIDRIIPIKFLNKQIVNKQDIAIKRDKLDLIVQKWS